MVTNPTAGMRFSHAWSNCTHTKGKAVCCDECVIAALEAHAAPLLEEIDALRKFKSWVHAYLDDKGIPANPGGPHSTEGCRIGDRMDMVFAQIERLTAELKLSKSAHRGQMTEIERLNARLLEVSGMCNDNANRLAFTVCERDDARAEVEQLKAACLDHATVELGIAEGAKLLVQNNARLREEVVGLTDNMEKLLASNAKARASQRDEDARLCRAVAISAFHRGDQTAANAADECNLAIRNQTPTVKEEPK